MKSIHSLRDNLHRVVSIGLLLINLASNAQTESKNGWHITPDSTIRVLVVFAEIDFGSPNLNQGNATWQENALPTFANDWYDNTWTGTPAGDMTK